MARGEKAGQDFKELCILFYGAGISPPEWEAGKGVEGDGKSLVFQKKNLRANGEGFDWRWMVPGENRIRA